LEHRGTIAILDDDVAERDRITDAVRAHGHRVEVTLTPEHLRKTAATIPLDLVLYGLSGPDPDAVARLETFKSGHRSILVAAMAASPSPESVVRAFRARAYDFLIKPVVLAEVLGLADRAVALRAEGAKRQHLARKVVELERKLSGTDPFERVRGTSEVVQRLIDTLREVARADSTVLVTGESGTGKGLIARAIHDASGRAGGPYVEASCVAFSEGILHSELFGHEKGAFTGASRLKKGRFEMAHGGTIFLDEIGEISPATQLLLLRVLQDRTFERVGGEQTLDADVRLIAATNKDLEQAIEQGVFRRDLYYRLNVIPVHVPPLRERAEDVPILAQHFLTRCSRKMGRAVDGFEPEVLERLTAHHWPGNVRELENLIERMVVLSRTPTIGAESLPAGIGSGAPLRPVGPTDRREVEIHSIREALRRAGGNKKLAAEALGIHRTTLYARMRRYGIGLADAEAADDDLAAG
jgi:two-component system response regulator HydG